MQMSCSDCDLRFVMVFFWTFWNIGFTLPGGGLSRNELVHKLTSKFSDRFDLFEILVSLFLQQGVWVGTEKSRVIHSPPANLGAATNTLGRERKHWGYFSPDLSPTPPICTYILNWFSRNSQSFDAKFTSYNNSIFLGIMAGGSKYIKIPMRNSVQSNGLTSKIPFDYRIM